MARSPVRPVLTHPVLRRVLPGLAVSAIGDGMSTVAIGWLALQLAPAAERGTWVAAAVAAYSLPSALGGIALRRLLRGRGGAQLAGWNALLRAAGLGAVAISYALGALPIGWYVALLAVSSLLAAWGSAGRYTLIAELLPTEHHLAANGVMTAIGEFATIAGPPLAGLLIGWSNAATVIAIDAASFAVLAATYRYAMPKAQAKINAVQDQVKPLNDDMSDLSGTECPDKSTPNRSATAERRKLQGLLALSFAFFLCFGPFYTAMPVHVAEDLHGGATSLGFYYTAFGVGALLGGVATAQLRRLPLWPATVGVVALFGAAMLPLGLGAPAGVALPVFAVAGVLWAPYLSTTMAIFQRSAPPERLPQVLAAFGSVTVIAVPVGAAVGGPLVAAVGAERTLLVSALATIGLGVVAGGVMLTSRVIRAKARDGRVPAGMGDVAGG